MCDFYGIDNQYGLSFCIYFGIRMAIFNNGNMLILGCMTWSNDSQQGECPSDARLKADIRPFPPGLGKLAQLEPVHFNWNPCNPHQYGFGFGQQTCLICQQVEKVFPDMVTVDEEGYRRVNYGQLSYLLLQGVRELKARNESLRAETEDQSKQIEQTCAEIAKLRQAAAAQGVRPARLDQSSAAKARRSQPCPARLRNCAKRSSKWGFCSPDSRPARVGQKNRPPLHLTGQAKGPPRRSLKSSPQSFEVRNRKRALKGP